MTPAEQLDLTPDEWAAFEHTMALVEWATELPLDQARIRRKIEDVQDMILALPTRRRMS